MKRYAKPSLQTEQCFETTALACAKTFTPPAGSHHMSSAYDTFTGHLGPGFGTNSSVISSAGVGFGPGGTSASYGYAGLCGNWVSLGT
jgi:hypothetical protein